MSLLSRRGAAEAPGPSPRFAAAGDEPVSRGVCPELLPGSRHGQRNPPPLPAGTVFPVRCRAPSGSVGQVVAVAVLAAELPSLPGMARRYLPT